MLYVVPTPVGNLSDITFRAIEVLQSVDLILAEDTRHSGKLLKHFQIETPMRSYHAHNEHKIVEGIVDEIKKGKSMALITDAGTPGISDPGFLLIHAFKNENITVTTLPGPTAFVPALVSSGIPCDKFFFEGFLPVKKGRKTRFLWLYELNTTIVLYESPFRLIKTLKEIEEYFGKERKVCVAREISKVYEEIVTGSVEEIKQQFDSRPKIKGEIVLIISK